MKMKKYRIVSELADNGQSITKFKKEMPSLAELGGCHKCANYVLNEIGDIFAMSKIEIVNAIVGKVFEYSKKREL